MSCLNVVPGAYDPSMCATTMKSGVPHFDDRRHFEFLVGRQAGAAVTILRRREAYAGRRFDPATVAVDAGKIDAMLQDSGLIRNGVKSSFGDNARFMEIRNVSAAFRLPVALLGGKPLVGGGGSFRIPASTDLSVTVSRDLKQRGFNSWARSLFTPPSGHGFGKRSPGQLFPLPGTGRR